VERVRSVITSVINKASRKDVSLLVQLVAIGIFFVLIAITYSIIYRGSVIIDVKAEAKAEAKK